MYCDVIIAGFGGQGILFIGNVLAHAAMKEGKHVTYLPTYGVEMRGGTANCTVVISSEEIGSPVIGMPSSTIIMNSPSLKKFEQRLKPSGLLLFNSSMVDPKDVSRGEVEILPVPLNEIASQLGNVQLANMVALGAFVEKTLVVKETSILSALTNILDERNHDMIPLNIQATEEGRDFIRKRYPVG
jgi:2-oxoglutarate ferredoxin oxidoreductase subunit gamma